MVEERVIGAMLRTMRTKQAFRTDTSSFCVCYALVYTYMIIIILFNYFNDFNIVLYTRGFK